MRRKLPPLNALRVFEVAAQLHCFTRAAEKLNVIHGSVSKQVKNLERRDGGDIVARAPFSPARDHGHRRDGSSSRAPGRLSTAAARLPRSASRVPESRDRDRHRPAKLPPKGGYAEAEAEAEAGGKCGVAWIGIVMRHGWIS
ncbi:LysR family transcriptional regulator [Mesorhizobium sp. M1339]|uniref:LysR family transcriptional regulator n=1 Tax=Mesorhizobium sp. M1339 TaxID=2957086 RepID=UPI00333671CB